MKKPTPIVILLLVAVFSLISFSSAIADEITELISVDSDENQGNDNSHASTVSADGLYVAFTSEAYNLVYQDYNSKADVFLRDRRDGQTTLISVNRYYSGYGGYDGYSGGDEYVEENGGITGNFGSFAPSISADGQRVAFWSLATNLVYNYDNNFRADVFVRDIEANETFAVSVDPSGYTGNKGSYAPSISANGRYVAFESFSTNLLDDPYIIFIPHSNIFVRDTDVNQTYVASVKHYYQYYTGYGGSYRPSISADGKRVAFESSAYDLVEGDQNGYTDIFVRDFNTGTTYLVSVSSTGDQANDWSTAASISADGRYVAFFSWATNLLGEEPNSNSFEVDKTANGYYHGNIFVHDLETGETTGVTTDDPTIFSVGYGGRHYISEHGRDVAFSASVAENGFPPSPTIVPEYNYEPGVIDEDFTPDAGGYGGIFNVYVRDRQEETTTMVSVSTDGSPSNDNSYRPTISDNGLYTSFTSVASNLVDDDYYGYSDVFIRGPVPVIDAIDPAFGLAYEWTEVTITGSGFLPGADLYFDDILLGDMAVLNPTTISALTPTHDEGFVDVTVVNPDGYSDTLYDGFEYICPRPTAPDDLAAYKNGLTDIFLSWNDNSDIEDGFYVERKDGEGGSWELIDILGPDSTSYGDNDLEQQVVYFYRVAAYNLCGDSEYTNIAVMGINYIPLPGEVIGPNYPPIPDAGEDQIVCIGDTVMLDGSGSWDFNGEDILTFEWSIVSAPAGSTAALTSTDTPETSFVALVPGEYVVQITVTDGDFIRSIAVTITVSEDCSGSATSQLSDASSGGCFVATAAHGSADAPAVQRYIMLRDRYLLNTAWGRTFISLYYAHSPRIADMIAQSEALRSAVRVLISPYALLLIMGVVIGTATALGARRS
jgi:hypothetical protein